MDDYALSERDEPALTGVERELSDAVSADEPWSLVEQFADLERVSGSADERRAAELITERLDSFGVEYVRHDPELRLSIPEAATLTADGESFDAVKTVAFGGGTATGPIVAVDEPTADPADADDAGSTDDAGDAGSTDDAGDAGSTDDAGDAGSTDDAGEAGGADDTADATDADDDGDDLLGADLGELPDVEGKIALLSGVLPIEAIERLEAAGAAGVIVQHPHEREPHEGIATPVWGGAETPRSGVSPPAIPILTVAAPVGRKLRATEPTTAEVTAETTDGWFECPLVHARIIPDESAGDESGSETAPDAWADRDEEFVLLHGHYDSWHVGVADNATGDAALLELARVFERHSHALERELWVCWWPGHSTGRYAGSTWFADTHATAIRERCVTQVNVDSPGSVDATEFEDMVVWMPEADALCRNAIEDVCGKDATENRPPRAGDYSFDNLGVTGAFMLSSNIPREVREARGYHTVGGCGGHSDAWHLTTDTLDKADPDVLVRDIRVYAVTLARLLSGDVLPLEYDRTLTAHAETVAAYDRASAFDLGPVRAAIDRTQTAVEEFYGAVERGEIDPATANATLRAIGRPLVRVNFTTEGAFDHDPAYDRPPYPGLELATELDEMADHERRRTEVDLRRQRNRAVELLDRARRAAERGLAGETPTVE